MFNRIFAENVYYVYYCSVDLGKLLFLATENNGWWQKCTLQHTEFRFLPVSKAVKAISCITDFGVSTAIITFFEGGAS